MNDLAWTHTPFTPNLRFDTSCERYASGVPGETVNYPKSEPATRVTIKSDDEILESVAVGKSWSVEVNGKVVASSDDVVP